MANSRKIEPVHVFVEIAVITIGILIAYQLNAWKEQRVIDQTEKNILREIKSNLQLDKIDLLANQKAHRTAATFVDSLRNWEGEYQPQIAMMLFAVFRDYLFLPQTSAFETLKSKGVDLIANDSIRIGVQRLHDFHYQVIIDYELNYQPNQFYDDFILIAQRYFQTFPVRNEHRAALPKSTQTSWLQEDSEVAIRLDLAEFEHRFCLSYYEYVESEMDQIIRLIDKELAR